MLWNYKLSIFFCFSFCFLHYSGTWSMMWQYWHLLRPLEASNNCPRNHLMLNCGDAANKIQMQAAKPTRVKLKHTNNGWNGVPPKQERILEKTMWVFPKIVVLPNHPLKNRVFHYFHHPFWGKKPLFLETTMFIHVYPCFFAATRLVLGPPGSYLRRTPNSDHLRFVWKLKTHIISRIFNLTSSTGEGFNEEKITQTSRMKP